MKKQIITIISVALATILLFTVYSVFLKGDNDDLIVGNDPYATVPDEVQTALDGLKNDVKITVSGYDSAKTDWEMIYRYALALSEVNDRIEVLTESIDGFTGIRVATENSSKDLSVDDFFKTLYDGTRYAFDGTNVLANAVFELEGMSTVEAEPVPLSGYDADGDHVTTSGAPLIFPMEDRSNLAYVNVENSHGEFSLYQDSSGTFRSADSVVATFDDEMLAQFLTYCRYPITHGKVEIPAGQSWADYGLDFESEATTPAPAEETSDASDSTESTADSSKPVATVSVVTKSDSNGEYALHTVYIGKDSGRGYHYARYVGGIFKPSETEGEADVLVHNLTKDVVYLYPSENYTTSLSLPQTDLMTPKLISQSITDTTALLEIEDIRIDLYDKGINGVAKNIDEFIGSANLYMENSSALTTILTDKVSASDYSAYSGGWTNNKSVFAGFTSNDQSNKTVYIQGALAKYAKNGSYKVKFGLLRDESANAYLPAKITVEKSYDGINFVAVENGTVSPEQPNSSTAQYEVSFTDEKVVRHVRIKFTVPQAAGTYVVFDEIRIFADEDDAQPVDHFGGTWKLTSPSQYLADGFNYAHLDMTNFNDFVQSMATLEGERVVACGFSADGDASPAMLDKKLLEQYGLASPAKHFSYEYNGLTTDIYVSAPNEEGKYYAYSTYSGEVDGKHAIVTTDVIVELSESSAMWLNWEFKEYLDHSLFSIYFTDLIDLEVVYDGVTHHFDMVPTTDSSNISAVLYNGESYHVRSFQYLYQSMLSITMHDEYVPQEGDDPQEYLRIRISSETNSPEIIFYKLSETRCSFTVNGEGSYYVLKEDVDEVVDRLERYVAGEIIKE